MIEPVGVLVEQQHGGDERALALGLRAGRVRLLRGRQTVL